MKRFTRKTKRGMRYTRREYRYWYIYKKISYVKAYQWIFRNLIRYKVIINHSVNTNKPNNLSQFVLVLLSSSLVNTPFYISRKLILYLWLNSYLLKVFCLRRPKSYSVMIYQLIGVLFTVSYMTSLMDVSWWQLMSQHLVLYHSHPAASSIFWLLIFC